MQSLTAARQNAFYRGEQIDVIDWEAAGICRRQDAIRTPLHQRREVVCQDLLRVDDERGVAQHQRDPVRVAEVELEHIAIAVAESCAGAGINRQQNDVQRVEEIRELNGLVQRQQRLNHRHDVDALGRGLNGHCVQVLERVRVAEAAILQLRGVFESIHGLESKKRVELIPQKRICSRQHVKHFVRQQEVGRRESCRQRGHRLRKHDCVSPRVGRANSSSPLDLIRLRWGTCTFKPFIASLNLSIRARQLASSMAVQPRPAPAATSRYSFRVVGSTVLWRAPNSKSLSCLAHRSLCPRAFCAR